MKKFRIYMDNNRDKIVEGDSVLYDGNYIVITRVLLGLVFMIKKENFRRLEVIEDEEQKEVSESKENFPFSKLQEKFDAKSQKNFSLSDLETGMYIRTRDDIVYLVLKDCFYNETLQKKTFFINKNGYKTEDIYREDLTSKIDKRCDIMEVFICCGDDYVHWSLIYGILNLADVHRKTIWERK